MDDAKLNLHLCALHHKDLPAFEELYTALKTPVFTVLLRIVQNRALAEDLLQEYFIKLYQSPPQAPLQKPRAYLFQMARNLAIDGMRKQVPTTEWSALENTLSQTAPDPAVRLDVEQALSRLPLPERQLITLRLNAGLRLREIARILGLPLGTVLWKYQKVIGTLRSLLDGGV